MANLSPNRFRAFDANGDPLSGGKLYTYVAGTTTPLASYTTQDESVANANPVILDADGYADVWLGTGFYKLVLTDSDDVTLWTIDDVVGASSSEFGSQVVSISANTNINSTYEASLIICTASLTLSLLAAATAGNGFYFIVKNDSAGNVTIDPDGSETINGSSTDTILPGKSAVVISDGTGWYTVSDGFIADNEVTGAKVDETDDYQMNLLRIEGDGLTSGLEMYDNNAPTDEKFYVVNSTSGFFVVQAREDDGTLIKNVISIDRTGTNIDEVDLDADLLDLNGSINSSTGQVASAWCTFDGTLGSPTVIQGYNVSSITKNGTGDYTINFTNALSTADYAFTGALALDASNRVMVLTHDYGADTKSTSALQIKTYRDGGTSNFALADCPFVSVMIFSPE